MKVLWIVTTPFPEAESLITGIAHNQAGSGGWLFSSAEELSKEDDICLYTLFESSLVRDATFVDGKYIKYIVLPQTKDNVIQKCIWDNVIDRVKPDVVHIHGTEKRIGLSYVKACGTNNVAVSIQGLMSGIARYYNIGLTIADIIKHRSFYERVRRCSLLDAQRFFYLNGELEKELLKSVRYVIGRTNWDKSHSLQINPSLEYFSCNESLRSCFYTDKWSYEKCIPYSIFLSQANYPVKGLHLMLKALAIVKKKNPNVILRIAGKNFIEKRTLKEKIKSNGYANIISDMIDKYNLKDNVTFTGLLTAEEMKKEYLNANVFVCPSTIENSPNSLGEAQMLGVPCIASYVGGIPDFIPDNRCGLLYRCEEYEMLADDICSQFQMSANYDNTYMRSVALARHNRENILRSLVQIYHSIYDGNEG